MATGPSDTKLRAMAEHRGLKLIRSRKRTPGVGDFGKFGLADATGAPLLGIGDEGLTATAQEIEDYLRGGALSTWKLSAERTPDAKPPKKKPPAEEDATEEGPVRRRGPAAVRTAVRAKPTETNKARPKATRPGAKPVLRIVPKEAPAAEEADLTIRPARPADAADIEALLRQLTGPKIDKARFAGSLASLRSAKGGMLIAERVAVVGCCAWAIVPTIQRGAIGRITLLLVDKPNRRSGVATAMVEAAQSALKKAGCNEVEAMSDIQIDNAHNFFRKVGFEQKSYRFVRPFVT